MNQNSVIGNETLNITGKLDGASQFGILVAGDPIAYQAVAMRFFNTNASTVVGSIVINASSTSFNTTSDYRLKEDFQEVKGLEKVQSIKVYDYKWKAEEGRMDGVLAHELAEVLPYAVTGEKDDIYEDGTEKMQGVDYSKIVPVLIKAIQELKQEIDTLKNI